MAEGSKYAGNLLFVCAICKRIRDDEGNWSALDERSRRPGQQISHAICPECGAERYPHYPERRAHPRALASLSVAVRVALDDGIFVVADGVTANISRGGMLALFPDPGVLGEQAACTVRFKDASGKVAPELVAGRILRSGPRGPDFEVAIRFDVPLESLSVPMR